MSNARGVRTDSDRDLDNELANEQETQSTRQGGEAPAVSAEDRLRFSAVADGILSALATKDEPIAVSSMLSSEERRALHLIREARFGIAGDRHLQVGQRKYGLERALATLRPVLALGRTSGFAEGAARCIRLERALEQLRAQLAAEALNRDQLGLTLSRQAPKKDDDDDDDDDSDDDDSVEQHNK